MLKRFKRSNKNLLRCNVEECDNMKRQAEKGEEKFGGFFGLDDLSTPAIFVINRSTLNHTNKQ